MVVESQVETERRSVKKNTKNARGLGRDRAVVRVLFSLRLVQKGLFK